MNPINLTLHVDELTHALDFIKSRIFIVDETLHGKIPAINEGSYHARQLNKIDNFTLGSKASKGWPRLPLVNFPSDEEGLELHNPIRANEFDERKTHAEIYLSSGTTGAPQAAMLSHFNLVAAYFQ